MTTVSKSIIKLGLNVLGKSGLTRAAQPVFGGIGAILMFHHVSYRARKSFGGNTHLAIEPEFLVSLLSGLRAEGFDIISLDEALRRIAHPKHANPFVVLTFDDGYRDNIENAYTILKSFKAPFTLYACSGFVDRSTPIWWLTLEELFKRRTEVDFHLNGERHVFPAGTLSDKYKSFERALDLLKSVDEARRLELILMLSERCGHDPYALTDGEMATWDDLKRLSRDPLVTIGAHTITHPFLSGLDEADALDEMIGGADRIEDMLGARPKHFAYPYGFDGAVSEREVRLAEKAGFASACTTRKGLILPDHADWRWSLPRVSVNGHYQDMDAMRALFSGLPFFVANKFKRFTTL